MHITKTFILTMSITLCFFIGASQEGQAAATTGQGYFAWLKSFFTRQQPTVATPPVVSVSEEAKPISQAQPTSTPTPAPQASGHEETKPVSQAQQILRGHYLSMIKQLNEAQSATDLSHEEIRQLALADLDADIAHLEQKIDALGDTSVRTEASTLIPLLSQLVERWRQGTITETQADKIIEDYKEKIDVLRRVYPTIYKYMQRLGDKIDEQGTFIRYKIAAIPLPNRGVWKEVYTLVQNICNANNMPIPKLYYGNDGQIIGSAKIINSNMSISGRPVIFIPQQHTKSSAIENLKADVVHELGHLYFGHLGNPQKKGVLKSVKSLGILSDDFWQKQNYRQEYAADIFAAFYGFGEESAKSAAESHIHETINEHFKKLLEEEAEKNKEKKVGSEKKKKLETHPTPASLLKNLLEAGQTKPGFINVPHMDLSTRPFEPANRITADTSAYHEVISPAAFEKMKGPVWTQRPYVGPKKIDISATPIYKKPAPIKPIPGQPDYSFRSGLQNVAAKATYILKKIPK